MTTRSCEPTSQEVHVHVLDRERSDDTFGMACSASTGAMVCRGAVHKVGLPLVLAPQIIALIHLQFTSKVTLHR